MADAGAVGRSTGRGTRAFGVGHRGARQGPRVVVVRGGAVAVLAVVVLMVASTANAAQPPVNLGTAESFAVLAGAGLTNTGQSTITGDVGTFPTTTETGFDACPGADCVTLNGTNHKGDAVTQGAKDDLTTAYKDAAGRTPVTTIATELGGQTLKPGVYDSQAGTFGITGTLTLDAQGDPNGVFIFQMASTLITASSSKVSLLGAAQGCDVFWQVGSSATLGTGSTFKGNILALTDITVTNSVTVAGRVLARNGAVTLDTDTIKGATCSGSTTPPPSSTPPTTGPTPSGTVGTGAGGTAGGAPAAGIVLVLGGTAVVGGLLLALRRRRRA